MSHRTKTSSTSLRWAVVIGLVVSLPLTGCSIDPGQGASSTPGSASPSYGDVAGTGETAGAANGVYETISVGPHSALNVFNDGNGIPAGLAAGGWTQEDGVAGQKLAVDFMVKEFFDSPALEGGPAEFEAWRQSQGKTYFTETASESVASPEAQGVILSNAKGKTLIPVLIHDGKPRVKNVNLKVTGFRNYDEARGIIFSFDFSADYRVSDAAAAAFVGSVFTNQSGDEFLKSDKAKPHLKDGSGENIYRGQGFANVVVDKDDTGAMKIVGVTSKADFNTDDFTY